MTLHYSEDRWYALHHVAELMVMHHTSSEVTAPGFSWSDTPMTEGLHSVLTDLHHAQLIRIGPHRPWGSQVFLTFAGSQRLAEWNLQHAGGVA